MNHLVSSSLLLCFSLLCGAVAGQRAAWMSGKWGVGYRIPAGGMTSNGITNYYIPGYNISGAVNQIVDIGGVSWVIINLTGGAFGDVYMAWHSVLTNITPSSTPPYPANGGRDLFMELADAFQAKGIKVIAYIATQGPAMLKHGVTAANDYNETCGCSQGMINWSNYVTTLYGNASDANLKTAFATVVIDEYAARYTTRIDGWWFDHASYGNIPLLKDTVRKYNNATVLAFNDGQNVPLTNNYPGIEDYTYGHPNPIVRNPSSSILNLPMVTSIEARNTSANPGYFAGSNGELSLGHIFMPMCADWNTVGSPLVWNVTQAVDWMSRVLKAKGSWTWNIPRENNGYTTLSFLNYTDVAFLKQVLAALPTTTTSPTQTPTSVPTTVSPTFAPTLQPTTSAPTQSPTSVPTTASPTYSPTSQQPTTSAPTQTPTSVPTTTSPTYSPTLQPTQNPGPPVPTTRTPTQAPTLAPTKTPTSPPTRTPTKEPTSPPTRIPTKEPTSPPTRTPTSAPTSRPTKEPTSAPTRRPTKEPTSAPTRRPTKEPTSAPTRTPTSAPTSRPTKEPTSAPTSRPTREPTSAPTSRPTKEPTSAPTRTPTSAPTSRPTKEPTSAPTSRPTKVPTSAPTRRPTKEPTSAPTRIPTKEPTSAPTRTPTSAPTSRPTREPTSAPTSRPTKEPTSAPTRTPTTEPTSAPVIDPTEELTSAPIITPTQEPLPTLIPTQIPTSATAAPTQIPTTSPSSNVRLLDTTSSESNMKEDQRTQGRHEVFLNFIRRMYVRYF